MENKESATAAPLGICEKLFNALHLNPTFRSIRRISYRPQEPVAAAATVPSPPPPVSSSVTKGPTPPSKPSGPEHPVGAAAAQHQPGLPEKRAPEPRPSRVEPDSASVFPKAPSKVEPPSATVLPKSSTYVQPPTPLPSSLPTERVSDIPVRSPTLAPAPAPERVASKVDGAKEGAGNEKPGAVELGRARTTTKKNLNDKIDEYINRTKNKMRTSSSAGSSSAKGARN